MTIHAWAELPKRPNQPEYVTVVSDQKGYHCIYHCNTDPPSQNSSVYNSLEVAMIYFAFGVSGHYPLPSYDVFKTTIPKEDLA